MKKQYPEDLETPIPVQNYSYSLIDPDAEDNNKREDDRVFLERLRKMSLLREHYSIDKSDPEGWMKLAFHLAVDHVRGFQVTDRRHKPKKWDSLGNLMLVSQVEKLASGGMTYIDACRHLCKDSRYIGEKPGTLKRRLEEARSDPLVQAIEALATDTGSRVETFTRAAQAFTRPDQYDAEGQPPANSR